MGARAVTRPQHWPSDEHSVPGLRSRGAVNLRDERVPATEPFTDEVNRRITELRLGGEDRRVHEAPGHGLVRPRP